MSERVGEFVSYVLEREGKREQYREEIEMTKKRIGSREQEIGRKKIELESVREEVEQRIEQMRKECEKIELQSGCYGQLVEEEQGKIELINRMIQTQRQQQRVINELIEQEQSEFELLVDKNEEEYKQAIVNQFQAQKKCIMLSQNMQLMRQMQQEQVQLMGRVHQIKQSLQEERQGYNSKQRETILQLIHAREWQECKQRILANIGVIRESVVTSKESKYRMVREYFSRTRQGLLLTQQEQQFRTTKYYEIYEPILDEETKEISEILEQQYEEIKKGHSVSNDGLKELDVKKEQMLSTFRKLDSELNMKILEIAGLEDELQNKQKSISELQP